MARSFSASTSNYIGASAALVTAAPLILAGWAKPASTSGAYTILSITDSASDQNHFDLTQLNNTMLAECKDTATSSASVTGVTSGAWQHFAAAFLSSTSRYAYLNGKPGTEETTSRTPSAAALNRTTIGLLRRLTLNFPYNGDIGPCAVYTGASITKAVADDIIGQLAKGKHPRDVRPDLLVECWDLTDRGSTLIGMMGAMALSVTGTCNPTDNPTIIRRRPQMFVPSVVSGSTIINLLTANFTFTGQGIQSKTALTFSVNNNFLFSGKSIQNKLTTLLNATQFRFTPNNLNVSGGNIIDLTRATFAFTGKTINVIQNTLISLTAATFRFIANAITVNIPGAVTTNQPAGSMLMMLARRLMGRRYRNKIGKHDGV